MTERYSMEYLHHESSHWQTAGRFDTKEEALKFIKDNGYEDFCDEIQLWDRQEAPGDSYPGPDEYNFDTQQWD